MVNDATCKCTKYVLLCLCKNVPSYSRMPAMKKVIYIMHVLLQTSASNWQIGPASIMNHILTIKKDWNSLKHGNIAFSYEKKSQHSMFCLIWSLLSFFNFFYPDKRRYLQWYIEIFVVLYFRLNLSHFL